MGWLLEWTFYITPCVASDNVSEQRFVRCYHFEQCIILSAMTAKTEMTLKRWRRAGLRRKGKMELWSYKEGRDRGKITGSDGKGGQEREERQRWIKDGKNGGWLKSGKEGEPCKSRKQERKPEKDKEKEKNWECIVYWTSDQSHEWGDFTLTLKGLQLDWVQHELLFQSYYG